MHAIDVPGHIDQHFCSWHHSLGHKVPVARYVICVHVSAGPLCPLNRYTCIRRLIIDLEAMMRTAHIYNLDSLASSNFAIETRCTSSGPSASRRVLAPLHMRANGKSSHTPAPPCTYNSKMLKCASGFCAVHWQVHWQVQHRDTQQRTLDACGSQHVGLELWTRHAT